MKEEIIKHVLKFEGLYSDHSADPGGATMRGITQKVLAEWRGHPVTKDDVKALTEKEAVDIYTANYWKPIHGDELSFALACVTMDSAVNSGVSRASKWLQETLGVAIDGNIGPKTIKAAGNTDAVAAAKKYMSIRLAFLKSLPTWKTFGKGWERRVNETLEFAIRPI